MTDKKKSTIPGKAYSYKSRRDKIKLRIIDGIDRICEIKGPEYEDKSRYYDRYDFSMSDPQGSYTGIPVHPENNKPVQDADDL